LAVGQDVLRWPVWTKPMRLADVEATLCSPWRWPTMQSRRWLSGKLYCFSRAELQDTRELPV
jgi:hypothetical protein